MKRWTVLLMLLLLPLTMAPRTSLNPDGGDLALTGILSRTQVRPGSAVTFVVQASNTTGSPLERAQLTILIGWDGKADALQLLIPRACFSEASGAGFVVTCNLVDVDPHEQPTVRVTARPLVPGLLTFAATSGGALAPSPADRTFEVVVRGRG